MKNVFSLFLGLLLINACSQYDNTTLEDSPKTGNGTISLKLTDSPFPFDTIASAEVSLVKIEVWNTAGQFVKIYENEALLDLLSLRNGVTQNLINASVPVGSYDQIRMFVSKGKIKLKDNREFLITIPSGAQTGIKVPVFPPIQVAETLSSDLLLDIDISKSFVPQGNPRSPNGITGFKFKPVARASNLSVAATVSGVVKADNLTPEDGSDDISLSGVLVKILKDESPIASTVTEADGSFKILGLAPGDYEVAFSAEKYGTKARNINLVAGNLYNLNETLNEMQLVLNALEYDLISSTILVGAEQQLLATITSFNGKVTAESTNGLIVQIIDNGGFLSLVGSSSADGLSVVTLQDEQGQQVSIEIMQENGSEQ